MNTFHTSLQLHCCIMCCIALLSSKQQQKTSSYRCVYNALILQAFIDRSRTLIEAETTSAAAAAECTFGYSFCFFAALFSFLAVPCSPDAQHTQLHLSMLHGSKNRTSTTWTWTTTLQKTTTARFSSLGQHDTILQNSSTSCPDFSHTGRQEFQVLPARCSHCCFT